jgi:AcrR family transcriptional regulator
LGAEYAVKCLVHPLDNFTERTPRAADEAQVSIGALHRYFRSTDDIFLALIGDIHKELFRASTSPDIKFKDDPHAALLAANRGYLAHYHANRNVIRAVIEATTVNMAYRDRWWWMREHQPRLA